MSAPSDNAAGAKSMTDRDLIEQLRKSGGCTIAELVEYAGVTATAIRQRITRLMEQGLVVRQAEAAGRGRPTHRYSLSADGMRCGGDNYEDLATVLWAELRAIEEPEVRRGLLQRIMGRLAEIYRDKIPGDSVTEKLNGLAALMHERDIPFEVHAPEGENQLPILRALACPYPDLAERDRAICSMEKMLFSEILGENLRLSACRLDGANGCTFELSGAGASAP